MKISLLGTAVQCFSYLNSRHKNIQFTTEFEQDEEIPFLDVQSSNANPTTPFPLPSTERKHSLVLLCHVSWVWLRYNLLSRSRWWEESPFIIREVSPIISRIKSGEVTVKPGFHMSGKFQTVWDLTVSRPSQILPTNENSKSKYLRSSGMNGNKSGESGAFLFSRRFPDFCDSRQSYHSRQMKTQIYTFGDVGFRRWWI